MLQHTGARVAALTWHFLARSGGLSTRAVLQHTGARVDASVASKILIFALPLEPVCVPISVDSSTEQVAPNPKKIDVLA